MSGEDEFSGLAFALGSVRGTRSFEVDKLGRLQGIYYRQTWTPGENLAQCRSGDTAFAGQLAAVTAALGASIQKITASDKSTYTGGYTVPQITPPVVHDNRAAESKKPHALDTCKHGFYAYYDGSDDYHSGVRVTGVIEGYGETLIGTRGFRCMKARIVALCITEETVRGHLVARNYSDIPQFASVADMLSEYPTDDNGQGLSPESDPDFWTRNF